METETTNTPTNMTQENIEEDANIEHTQREMCAENKENSTNSLQHSNHFKKRSLSMDSSEDLKQELLKKLKSDTLNTSIEDSLAKFNTYDHSNEKNTSLQSRKSQTDYKTKNVIRSRNHRNSDADRESPEHSPPSSVTSESDDDLETLCNEVISIKEKVSTMFTYFQEFTTFLEQHTVSARKANSVISELISLYDSDEDDNSNEHTDSDEDDNSDEHTDSDEDDNSDEHTDSDEESDDNSSSSNNSDEEISQSDEDDQPNHSNQSLPSMHGLSSGIPCNIRSTLKFPNKAFNCVELVRGSGIYVSRKGLSRCKQSARHNSCWQLGKELCDEIFATESLEQSTSINQLDYSGQNAAFDFIRQCIVEYNLEPKTDYIIRRYITNGFCNWKKSYERRLPARQYY